MRSGLRGWRRQQFGTGKCRGSAVPQANELVPLLCRGRPWAKLGLVGLTPVGSSLHAFTSTGGWCFPDGPVPPPHQVAGVPSLQAHRVAHSSRILVGLRVERPGSQAPWAPLLLQQPPSPRRLRAHVFDTAGDLSFPVHGARTPSVVVVGGRGTSTEPEGRLGDARAALLPGDPLPNLASARHQPASHPYVAAPAEPTAKAGVRSGTYRSSPPPFGSGLWRYDRPGCRVPSTLSPPLAEKNLTHPRAAFSS